MTTTWHGRDESRPATTLACSPEGVWLWPGVPLTRRKGDIIWPRSRDTILGLAARLHGPATIHSAVAWAVERAAAHLSNGEPIRAERALARAGLPPVTPDGHLLIRRVAAGLGVHMPNPPVGSSPRLWSDAQVTLFAKLHATEARAAGGMAKAGFDPDEPRDRHGRWTTGEDDGRPRSASVSPASTGGGARRPPVASRPELASWTVPVAAPTGRFPRPSEAPPSPDVVPAQELLFAPEEFPYLEPFEDLGETSGAKPTPPSETPALPKPPPGLQASSPKPQTVRPDPLGPVQPPPDPETPDRRDEPEVCPAPVPDRGNATGENKGRKQKDLDFEKYIHDLVNPDNPLKPGEAVRLWNPPANDYVYYDDCRRVDGTLIEAKGTGYAALLAKDIGKIWLDPKWLKQAQNQVAASGGRPIVWYFAEPAAAEHARQLFAKNGLSEKIAIVVTPWREIRI